MNCPICNKILETNKNMSYHFSCSHKQDYITYLVENKLIEVPKCKECGNNIDVITKDCKGRKKILNHPEELVYCSDKCQKSNKDFKKIMSENGKANVHFMQGREISDEERELKRQQTTERWKNPEYRANIIKKLTKSEDNK